LFLNYEIKISQLGALLSVRGSEASWNIILVLSLYHKY